MHVRNEPELGGKASPRRVVLRVNGHCWDRIEVDDELGSHIKDDRADSGKADGQIGPHAARQRVEEGARIMLVREDLTHRPLRPILMEAADALRLEKVEELDA